MKLTKTDEKTIRTILASCLSTPLSHIAILKPISRQVTQLWCNDQRRCLSYPSSGYDIGHQLITPKITTDEFIDVLIGRQYPPGCCSVSSISQERGSTYHVFVRLASAALGNSSTQSPDVYNKIDAISLETMDRLAHDDHTVVISCEMDLKWAMIALYKLRHRIINSTSLNYLIDRIWDDLGLVKVYTKKRGAHPDLFDPICMRKGSTIEVLTLQKHQLLILICYSGCLWRDPSLIGNKFSLCTSMVSFMCLPCFGLQRLNHAQGKMFSGAVIQRSDK